VLEAHFHNICYRINLMMGVGEGEASKL
jgi:hypothetical protein